MKHNVSPEGRAGMRMSALRMNGLNAERGTTDKQSKARSANMTKWNKGQQHREDARAHAIEMNATRVRPPEELELARSNLIALNKSPRIRELRRQAKLRYWENNQVQRQRARERAIDTFYNWKTHETGIEKKVRQILESLGIEFVQEKKMAGIGIIDFFCPQQSVCIEADGEWWHSRPWAIAKDKFKDKKIGELGFVLLRLPEREIDEQIDLVEEKIIGVLGL